MVALSSVCGLQTACIPRAVCPPRHATHSTYLFLTTGQSARPGNVSRLWVSLAYSPANSAVRHAVGEIIGSFQAVPLASWSRILAWPFCFAGSVVESTQESTFRGLPSTWSDQELGSIREAMEIMEGVWPDREAADLHSCEVAICMNILGHKSLLL